MKILRKFHEHQSNFSGVSKKIILLVFAVMFFTACQQEQRYFAESAETKTLEAGIAAYESGDWDKWKSHFSDTAKIYVNSKESVSVDTRMKQLQNAAATFSTYGFDREKEYVEMVLDKEKETWVYYWANWNAEIAANKNKLSVPVHLSLQFKDGKIVEEHIFFDGTNMAKEMEALATMTDTDKTIYSQIDSFLDDFHNKQDASVLGDIVSDDYVRYVNDVKVATGVTELQAALVPFFTGFPDFNLKFLHKSPIMDNAIFVHWELKGTNSGEFAGSPATGKKVSVTGLARLHFNEEGKLDSEHIHFDQLDLMQQLGKSLN